jgi:hypothetical protein
MHKPQQGISVEHLSVQQAFEEDLFQGMKKSETAKARFHLHPVRYIHFTKPIPVLLPGGIEQEYQSKDKRQNKKVKCHGFRFISLSPDPYTFHPSSQILHLKSGMDLYNKVPQIDSPRTNQLAFAAEHAFSDFFLQMHGFSPLDQSVDPPDVEICKMPGRTGCRATSASHTKPDGRLD